MLAAIAPTRATSRGASRTHFRRASTSTYLFSSMAYDPSFPAPSSLLLRSKCAVPAEHGRHSPEQDLAVQPQRPVIYVLQVQAYHVLKSQLAPPAHLP